MLKDVYQKYYFEQNYNCAETLLRAANDYYDLKLHDRDMIMVGAYGAGIQCGNTCGAVLAAASVLSMKYVEYPSFCLALLVGCSSFIIPRCFCGHDVKGGYATEYHSALVSILITHAAFYPLRIA